MAQGYIQTFLQFPDAKNGSLYVYTANSTNLALVYDPVNGNTISQPLSINSDGYCQQFWVDTENLYDLDVRSYLNQQVETRNNVSVLGGGSGAQGPQGNQGVAGPRGVAGPAGSNGADGADGTDGADGADGEDGVSLLSVRVDPESDFGRILYNKSDDENVWYNAGNVLPEGTGKVKVVDGDGLGYLAGKVVDGEGIAVEVTESNKLKVSNTAPDTLQTKVHAVSSIPGFLSSLAVAGTGINIALSADMEKLVFTATGSAVGGFFWKGTWDAEGTYNVNNAVWYFDHTGDLPVSRLYIATTQNQGINPYTDAGIGTGTCWSCMMAVDYMGDQFVMLDSTDTQSGYLADKLRAGNYVTLTRNADATGAWYTVDSVAPYQVSIGGVVKEYNQLYGVLEFVGAGGCSASWNGRGVQITGLGLGTTSSTAARGDQGLAAYNHSQAAHAPTNADNTQSAIIGAATKATPVDADSIPLVDSAAANTLKRVTWASIKTTIKSYLDTPFVESLRAQNVITGGGVLTVNSSNYIKWSNRFMVICDGNGSNFATAGYFDMHVPPAGVEITGIGVANKIVTADGIPLGTWEALYYILPIGSGPDSIDANFRVVHYNATIDIPENWIMIALRNGYGYIQFPNGVCLYPGESRTDHWQKQINSINTDLETNYLNKTTTSILNNDITGNAATATALTTTNMGDANTPVYFNDGKPVACTGLDLYSTGGGDWVQWLYNTGDNAGRNLDTLLVTAGGFVSYVVANPVSTVGMPLSTNFVYVTEKSHVDTQYALQTVTDYWSNRQFIRRKVPEGWLPWSELATVANTASSTHTHGNLSNTGALGTTSGLPVVTTTDGRITATAWSIAIPNMDGTASVGSSTVPSRSDHVHPSDTSRVAIGSGLSAGASIIVRSYSGSNTYTANTIYLET